LPMEHWHRIRAVTGYQISLKIQLQVENG